MPTQLVPGEDDTSAVMACIGYVCVQWSMLEQTILNFIGVVEKMQPEECYIAFGTLDIRPRLNMAIKLARYHNVKVSLIVRLEKIRKTIKVKKLDDRRNQAVHGVHSDSEKAMHVKLTMVRWAGDKREQDVAVRDILELGNELNALANEAHCIFLDYGAWKFGDHMVPDAYRQVLKTKPSPFFKLNQLVNTCRNHVAGWFN